MTAALPLALFAAAAGRAAEVRAPDLIQIAIVRQAVSAVIASEGAVRVVLPGGKSAPLEWKGELKLTPRVGLIGPQDIDRETGDPAGDGQPNLRLHVVDGVRGKRGFRYRQRALPQVPAVRKPLVVLSGRRQILQIVVIGCGRLVVDG